VCAVLLAGAGAALWAVPGATSDERAWEAAVPCTATTPAVERSECLSTMPTVIERTGKGSSRHGGWVYFVDGRPLKRVLVSSDDAVAFQPGDQVELTFWRGRVTKIAGQHHVWNEHMPVAGDTAVLAAGCVLAAGYFAAQLLLRLRGRRLPDDDVLPSPLPFAAALAVTALWLLPFCYTYALSLPDSPAGLAWLAVGSAVSLSLFAWAWHATRLRTPAEIDSARGTGGTGSAGGALKVDAGVKGAKGVKGAEGAAVPGEEVFLTARFLDDTDYSPHGFGTHIVLGGGSPAVTPHSGPGRFAAIRIPVERLTLTKVRRVRGSDGDMVSRNWHIAELDDAGTPVRLAAAPEDLARIIHALDLAQQGGDRPEDGSRPTASNPGSDTRQNTPAL